MQFDFSLENLTRIPTIIESFTATLFIPGDWNILWLILILSILCNFKRMNKYLPLKLLGTSIILFSGILFLNSLLSTNFVWISGVSSHTTLSRVLLHFFPLTVFLIILLNYPEGHRQE